MTTQTGTSAEPSARRARINVSPATLGDQCQVSMSTEPAILKPAVLALDPAGRTSVRAGMIALILYSLGHFFVDLYSGAVGAFQPIFVDKLHFTLTQAGILGGV